MKVHVFKGPHCHAAGSVLQVGVYMGKRDFVDRVDSVDPVGESAPRMPQQSRDIMRREGSQPYS